MPQLVSSTVERKMLDDESTMRARLSANLPKRKWQRGLRHINTAPIHCRGRALGFTSPMMRGFKPSV
jgi:hypothetical protein